MLLGQQQGGQPLRRGGRRDQPPDQQGRALVQRALGRSVGGALDPAVGRVRGAGVQPSQGQRARVHPRAVPVPVGQVGGPVRQHLVQQLAAGRAAREPFHPPAAAGDPLMIGMRVRVGPDPVQCAGRVRRVREIAAQHGEARERRVHVRVLEAGQHRSAAQVHHAGPGTGQLTHGVVGAHGDDPATAHRHRRSGRAIRAGGRRDHPAAARGHRVHRAAAEDQLRRAGRLRLRRLLLGGLPRRCRLRRSWPRGGLPRWGLPHSVCHLPGLPPSPDRNGSGPLIAIPG